jgi:DNA phosphorothioation-dependent restriction protein DptF
MQEFTFDFLQDLDPELVQLGRDIEKIFYDDPHGVLIKSRLFAERMTKIIATFEEMENLKHLKQVERINRLDSGGLFTKEVAQSFDTIRTIGNRAAHENSNGDLEIALKVHKNLFKISVWLMEVYGSHDFTTPTYKHPSIQKSEGVDSKQISDLIESTLSKQLADLLKKENLESHNQSLDKQHTEETEGKVVSTVPEKKENDSKTIGGRNDEGSLYGSRLLYQLSKLKESSQEAVESSNSFSSFKKYLHVERPIQKDLTETMEKMQSENGSQLIFLCGSVGDGKSHLLAHLSESRPDLLNEFDVHNDATESFDPQKNSLDTLAEVLTPFSDDNIEKTNKKLILAINLGVLHNFLESKYIEENYTRLAAFINKSGVFDTDLVSEDYSEHHFNLISFADYHPYQLTKEGPKSDYFTNLFEKIVQSTEENPFYSAYIKDKEEEVTGPVMTNYRLLQESIVRDKLSDILIKAIVQYKFILSTRTLLNFIHDILVPASIDEYKTSSTVIEETQVLLPNILFNSVDRSPLLKVVADLDPIHIRSEKTDMMLIELNNSKNISDVFQIYSQSEALNEWQKVLSDLGAFYELTKATRQLLNASLIRLAYFIGDSQSIFENDTYNRFMKHLYAFNVGIPAGLKIIYTETEEAVFAWKGGPRHHDSYIYFEESLGLMNIAQSLELKRYTSHLVNRGEGTFQRFKTTLLIGFQDKNKAKHAMLEIDYPLYETILKVLNGYRPNKKDKEDAIQFLEFIDSLMVIGNKEDEIVVYDSAEDVLFKLEYDEDFEEFSFKRE